VQLAAGRGHVGPAIAHGLQVARAAAELADQVGPVQIAAGSPAEKKITSGFGMGEVWQKMGKGKGNGENDQIPITQ